MTAQLSLSLAASETIPWNGGHGSFSVVNLNTANALTITLAATDTPGETIVLPNYGDNLSIDPVTLSAITLAAASYPASCSYVLSPLLGLTAATVAVNVPVVYGFSNYQVAKTTPGSVVMALTGQGGAPSSAVQFWLESVTLSYSLDGSEPFPPTASAWLAVLADSFDVTPVIVPGDPVSSIDFHHYSLSGSTVSVKFGASATVGVYITPLFSAQ